MQRYEIHLLANGLHFYLQDDDARHGDLSDAWLEGMDEAARAATRHALAVATDDDGEVQVTVEMRDEPPQLGHADWRPVGAASLRLDTGRVVVAGGGESFPDAFRIRVRPGGYESFVWQATREAREYRVFLCPSDGAGSGVRAPREPGIAAIPLDATHVAPYRELMLRAYAEAPDAFTSTREERASEPEAWWLKRIADRSGLTVAFGCFDGAALVGTVALEFSPRPKTAHKAHLIGMFVAAEARGRGVARALMAAALDHCIAREEITSVVLTVTEGNEPAIALYRAMGFTAFGVEPMALRTGAGYLSKVHMQLAIPRDA